jgi:hydrogenase expression/formation protein HypC
MCLGLPMKLLAKDGNKGRALYKGGEENVDLSLTPEAEAGDFMLVFLGAARQVIDEAFAREVEAAHAAIESVMQGGDASAGFADLVGREPSLPPHLQAALDAGRTTG